MLILKSFKNTCRVISSPCVLKIVSYLDQFSIQKGLLDTENNCYFIFISVNMEVLSGDFNYDRCISLTVFFSCSCSGACRFWIHNSIAELYLKYEGMYNGSQRLSTLTNADNSSFLIKMFIFG